MQMLFKQINAAGKNIEDLSEFVREPRYLSSRAVDKGFDGLDCADVAVAMMPAIRS